MAIENLYHILNIPDYSEIDMIKRSFRQLVLRYHPDRNPDPAAEDTFKTLVKTYEILSNPILKQAYDYRLKTGFDYSPTQTVSNKEERENRMKRYARMRKEQDALKEVENINRYENSLKNFPYKWRMILLSLLFITGILGILDGWYQRGSKIAFGEFVFVLSIVLIWNELYKHFWHHHMTKDPIAQDKPEYDRIARTNTVYIFLIGFILTIGLVQLKKVWHLHYFGKVIYAHLEAENNRIIYDFNNKFYTEDTYFIPQKHQNETVIFIRISTKEPEIWEYLD